MEEYMKMKVYVCIMKVFDTEKHEDKYYALCERNGTLIGFETMEKGILYFDRGYESSFKRGLCGATGATLAHVIMNPSIVEFETQAEMLEALFEAPPFKFGEIHSWNYGILCQKDASKYWKNGIEPELVKRIE